MLKAGGGGGGGGGGEKSDKRLDILVLERERVWLLSRFTGDPTVGSLRDKKESCSTQRGLRVGTRFREFPQTP